MSTRAAWIIYSVLRLLFFAVPFAVLYAIGWQWWAAALVATLVAVSLSVIFLTKPRSAASRGIHEWRTRGRTADDIYEDEVLDGAGSPDVEAPAESGTATQSNTDSDTR
ncbi:MAG: DUF4229 domain-containing protein [Leucobacter sp.]